MLNLKEEFQRTRLGALSKVMTSANEVMSKNFIEETVIPCMREQQKVNKTSNFFAMTFFVCPRGNISYNTRMGIEYNLGDSSVMTSEDVLTVAVCRAEEHGITAYKGHHDSFTVYRFEIKF